MKKPILFVTSNDHKFAEAESVLKDCGLTIERLRLRYEEARADSCEEVAAKSAAECFARFKRPLFVEDSGLFIDSLNGFPGTYSAWVFKKIGNERVLKLLGNSRERRARFVSAVGYADARCVKTFVGFVKGKVASRPRGKLGFGYDPVFVPDGWSETYGESDAAKERTSHRMKSLVKFAKWFKRR